MKKSKSFLLIFQQFLSKIMTSCAPHPAFYATLLSFEFLQFFIVLCRTKNLNYQAFFLNMSTFWTQIIVCTALLLQTIIVALMTIAFILHRKNVRKTQAQHMCVKKSNQAKSVSNILNPVIIYSLLTQKTVFTVPVISLCAKVFFQFEQNSMIQQICTPMMAVLFGITYWFSGLLFWNKFSSIITNSPTLSFGSLINFRSLVYVYAPVISTLNILESEQTCRITNLCFALAASLILFFHPLITLNHNRISQICSCALLSLFFVSVIFGFLGFYENKVLQGALQNETYNVLLFSLISLVVTYCLYRFVGNRLMKTILNEKFMYNLRNCQKRFKGQESWVNSFNEALFFFLMSFKRNRKSEELEAFLVTLSKKLKQKDLRNNFYKQSESANSIEYQVEPEKLEQNKQKIDENCFQTLTPYSISGDFFNEGCTAAARNRRKVKSIISKVNEILEIMKDYGKQGRKVTHLDYFCMLQGKFQALVMDIFLFQYSPPFLANSKQLGSKELSKEVNNYDKLFMLIAQVLLGSSNYKGAREAYFMLKYQIYLEEERLNGSTFMEGVEKQCLLSLIQERLRQCAQSCSQFNHSAEKYFIFEKNYDSLKKSILKACNNALNFWKEMKYDQPEGKVVFRLVEKNYHYQRQIELQYEFILSQFPRKSPMIMSELIMKYSELFLRQKIPSFLNFYNSLHLKMREQLKLQKKEGVQSTQTTPESAKSSLYHLARHYCVCLIDFQSINVEKLQRGRIKWANELFWVNVYGLYNETLEVGELIRKNARSIVQVMPPQLRSIHVNKYFPEFSHGQSMSLNHGSTYMLDRDTSVIHDLWLEIQILPSIIQSGFQVIMIMNKVKDEEKASNSKKSLFSTISQSFANSYRFLVDSKKGKVTGYTLKLAQLLLNPNQLNRTNFSNKSLSQEQDIAAQIQEFLFSSSQLQSYVRDHSHISTFRAKSFRLTQPSAKIQISNIFCQISVVKKTQYVDFQQQMGKTNSYLLNCFELKNVHTIADDPDLQLQYDASGSKEKQTKTEKNIQKPSSDEIKKQQGRVKHDSQAIIQQLKSSILTLNTREVQENFKTSSNQNDDSKIGEIALQEFKCQVQQKTEQQLRLEKSYKALISIQIPKSVLCWRKSSIFMACIATICIVLNIIISTSRQETYFVQSQTLKGYNELINDISQMLISLRLYNYYANVFGVDYSQIGHVRASLIKQSREVQESLIILKPMMSNRWQSYEFLSTGQIVKNQELDYAVISNFLLPAITFITLADPSQMTFPIIMSMYANEDGLTDVQRKYLQAVYNGLYICGQEMMKISSSIKQNIQSSVGSILNQIYIFPAIVGFCTIILFVSASIKNFKAMNHLYNEIIFYLERIPEQVKIQRLQEIDSFRTFVQNQKFHQENTLRYHSDDSLKSKQSVKHSQYQIQISLKSRISVKQHNGDTIKQDSIKQNEQLKNQKHSSENIQDQLQSSKIEKNPFENKDKSSELVKKDIIQNAQNYTNKKTALQKSTHNIKRAQKRKQFNMAAYQRQSRTKNIIFFTLLLPLLAYFIVIFAAALYFNSQIIAYLDTKFQLFSMKRNINYAYQWTMQGAFSEPSGLMEKNWYQLRIKQFASNYQSQRNLRDRIQSLSQQSHLRKIVSSVQNDDVCVLLPRFRPSGFHLITFTEDQCKTYSQGIMTKGFKAVFVKFQQIGIYLIMNYPQPLSMSYQQRIDFLALEQLKQMKMLLNYLQQINVIFIIEFQKDLQQLISFFTGFVTIFSAYQLLFLICFAILTFKHMLTYVKRQKKRVRSILKLISFSMIKENQLLRKRILEQMECQLYQ